MKSRGERDICAQGTERAKAPGSEGATPVPWSFAAVSVGIIGKLVGKA